MNAGCKMGPSRGSSSQLRGSATVTSRVARFSNHSGVNVLLLTLVVGLVAGCGGGGHTDTTPPPTAPSNLAYPQPTISATLGQAIATDTPTVSGAVTSYSISPALPAGLSLSTSTGAISGTPTAASAQASYTVTAQNSGGSTTASLQITVSVAAPSNLVYPTGDIVATVGLAIAPDTPTFTGTVSSFSISPALPASLSLNTSTGTISGTPIVASANTLYTVTAQNAAGSTTTTLYIWVQAGLGIFYAQNPITAIVGQAITPDIPGVNQAVGSYSISPALPAGLSFNPSTGMISGTPTAVSAQTSYLVEATVPGGFLVANITITVLPAQNSLLELGHGTAIGAVQFSNGTLLSMDISGHWVLWNYSSGTILASGDSTPPNVPPSPPGSSPGLLPNPIEMAGQTFAIAVPNGVEAHAVSDGHLLAIIPYPSDYYGNVWWQLASDGSYISIGSNLGLIAFTPSGQTLFSRTGDYSKAQAFAAPGHVLVALGPAGANVIETVSTADGSSSVGPAFSGTFNSWFLDGSKFITNLQDTIWVYSSASVQQAFFTLPTVENLTGEGNWMWTYQPGATSGSPLNIYPIGSDTPALSASGQPIPSGTTLFISGAAPGQASVIDLSGATPVQTNYNNIPVVNLNNTFAASSPSQWVAGTSYGVLLDGASLSGTPRYFGYGEAWSIAGVPGTAVVSTAIGQTLVFNPSGPSLQQTIDFASDKLILSSDGSVLGAAENLNGPGAPMNITGDQPSQNQTLNFYSLPSGNVLSSFPYSIQGTPSNPDLVDFSLSASGTTIGRITGVLSGTPSVFTKQVTPIAGSPVIWSVTGQNVFTGTSYPILLPGVTPILLSPDGTLIAEYTGPVAANMGTNIIQNGTVVTAVPGAGIGWIDNNRLLVNQYATIYPNPVAYTGAVIYNATGQQVAPLPALPQLPTFQTVDSDSIYNQNNNAIYSLTTGQPTWTGTYPTTGVGAVAGTYVVYASGHSIVIESY
jgi:hypothetical protein